MLILSCRQAALAFLAVTCMGVQAADGPSAGTDEVRSTPEAEKQTRLEGAIGPTFGWSPDYQGASRRKVTVTPGVFLRYGRLTISNTGAFVTRRRDDVFRGVGLDVAQGDRLRMNVGLRLDRGRRSSDSPELSGIHNVRETIRSRATATWQFDAGWKASTSWNADLLNRGGGQYIEASVSHDRRYAPDLTWTAGAGLTWGNRRFMQSYYGVAPDEAIASGLREYTPDSGLRDISVATGWRLEINPRWVAFWGVGVGRLLGPAADSPLTRSAQSWSVNGGVGWRF